MSFKIGAEVGPYKIEEKQGQGGMATVYKAYHARLDRHVAIKVLHPVFKEEDTFLRRFDREARVVAKLEHPNIVPIYDFAEDEGSPYLVMRFIEGETLKERLAERQLTTAETLTIAEAIAAGLDYAHSQGVLHRDIKPSNILLTPENGVYIADFGLARLAQAGESTLSQDMMMGTPQYISPEQAKGEAELDGRTDLYALAVILFELLTGQAPFSADTSYTIIHDHIFTPPPRPSTIKEDISLQVEAVLLKALAKERDERYETATAMVEALAAALRGETVAEETAVAPPSPQPSPEPASPSLPPLPDATTLANTSQTPISNPQEEELLVSADTTIAPQQPAATSSPPEVPAQPSPQQRPWVLIVGGIIIGMVIFGVLALLLLPNLRDNEPDQQVQSTVTDDPPPLPPTQPPLPPVGEGPVGEGPPNATLDRLFGRLPAPDEVRDPAELEALLAENPADPALRLELLAAYAQHGERERARELLIPLLDQFQSPLPLTQISRRFMEQNHLLLAALTLEQARQDFPTDGELQHLQMMNYFLLTAPSQEIEQLQSAFSEQPSGNILNNMAEAYLAYQNGDIPQALRLINDNLNIDNNPYRADNLFLRGFLLYQLEEMEQAEETLQEALDQSPEWLRPHIERLLNTLRSNS